METDENTEQDHQILIVVDIYPGVSEDALETLLPHKRKRREILRLTDFDAPRLEQPPRTTPVDWFALGDAIEALSVRVHQLQEDAKSRPTKLYIGGRAPLSVFIHLGFVFTKSIQHVVVFNTPPGNGPWEPFRMAGLSTNIPAQKIYDKEIGFPREASKASGRVGIFVDSANRSESTEPFEALIKSRKENVAGILELRTWEPLKITDIRMPAIGAQFAQLMSGLSGYYPKRTGIALFTGGPAQIAFALGRAISPNVLVGDVVLTEYLKEKDEYEYVYSLPYVPRVEPEIPSTPEAKEERERVLSVMIEALAELQQRVARQHLPRLVLSDDERTRFIKRLGKLKIMRNSVEGQPFQLRVHEGECFLGEGILNALVPSKPEQQKDFAKLLLLHEILHDWQALRNTNHSLVGRAGFVLEHIDYLADVFAVQTLVHVDLDHNEPPTGNAVRSSALKWLDMVLHGIEAFDKAEQGPVKMVRLAERRLRRYLLWHIQFARARTIETEKHFDDMMQSSLTVELAPLEGWVDAKRWEKMVKGALSDTELCIAVDGRLVRADRRPNFNPESLVEALLAYDRAGAHKQVNAVVDQERDKLMPWTKEG